MQFHAAFFGWLEMKSLAKRWWFWALVVIAVAFVILHTYLAIWVRDYVNRKLSEIPGYRAHVAAVTLHLWRGAYQIHNIDIKKTSGKVPVPFFSAPLVDEGRPLRTGDARSQISLDPYASRPTFAFNLEVKDTPLVKLNDFAKAYGNFTFKDGTLKLAMEASANHGGYQGYIEPVFDHMVIFNEKSAENPVTFVWEAILGGLTQVIRNYPKDRFGTKVPFSGTFEHPQPDEFATIFNAFHNAFVKAFEGKIEDWKKVPKVEPEKKQ